MTFHLTKTNSNFSQQQEKLEHSEIDLAKNKILKLNFSRAGLTKIIRDPLKNKFISSSFIVSLLLNMGIWWLLYLFIKPTTEPILLHYNIYFGIDLIGAWYKIYLIPLSGLVIILVNYLGGAIMYPTKKELTYLILGFTIPLQIFLVLAAILNILINT